MKPTTLLSFLLPTLTSAYYNGFNVAAQNPDGSCKSYAQWKTAFSKLSSAGFHEVRLFASSDCDTLANAVPAAIATKTKILVGVWTEDDGHFAREKGALEAAIKKYGSKWLIAVSVGSEDLYRGDTDANTLAGKIYDVRGMIRSLGAKQWVGHTDTWTAWVDGANAAVIKASDFVCNDAYPYWQGAPVSSGHQTLVQAMKDVKSAVARVKPGTQVWLCESGWPVKGKTVGSAKASVANAARYWKEAACPAFKSWNTFWYAYQDYTEVPSFGVFAASGKTQYSLKC